MERAWQSYVKDWLVWCRFLCREGCLGLVFGGEYLGKRGEAGEDIVPVAQPGRERWGRASVLRFSGQAGPNHHRPEERDRQP